MFLFFEAYIYWQVTKFSIFLFQMCTQTAAQSITGETPSLSLHLQTPAPGIKYSRETLTSTVHYLHWQAWGAWERGECKSNSSRSVSAASQKSVIYACREKWQWGWRMMSALLLWTIFTTGCWVPFPPSGQCSIFTETQLSRLHSYTLDASLGLLYHRVTLRLLLNTLN